MRRFCMELREVGVKSQFKPALVVASLAFLFLVGCGDTTSAKDDGNETPTSAVMTDERDGQVYKIVVIGSYVWMAENLNYEYKVNGAVYGNWCPGFGPFDEPENCAKYGRLYTWGAAMDSVHTHCGMGIYCTSELPDIDPQGVCPNGWRLPSIGDWRNLFSFVGGETVAATALKASSGWNGDGNGTDAYGFSALPSGHREYDNGSGIESEAYFWSLGDVAESHACRVFFSQGAAAIRDFGQKDSGYAVRCIKDVY